LHAFLPQKNGVDYIKHENPDMFCLQETKCSESKLPPEVKVDGYHTYWLSGKVLVFHSVEQLRYSAGAVRLWFDNAVFVS
jgi:exonuclease III